MIHINYDKNEFKRDYTRYVLNLRKTYLITIGIAVIVSFGLILFKNNFSESIQELSTFVLVFTIGATLFTIYDISKLLISIPKAAKTLPTNTETLTFHSQRMKLSHLGTPIVIFHRDLKGYKIIRDTIFLISKNKESWPIRLNPKEISYESMEFLVDKLKQIGISRV